MLCRQCKDTISMIILVVDCANKCLELQKTVVHVPFITLWTTGTFPLIGLLKWLDNATVIWSLLKEWWVSSLKLKLNWMDFWLTCSAITFSLWSPTLISWQNHRLSPDSVTATSFPWRWNATVFEDGLRAFISCTGLVHGGGVLYFGGWSMNALKSTLWYFSMECWEGKMHARKVALAKFWQSVIPLWWIKPFT